MPSSRFRKLVLIYLLLLVPVAWLAKAYERFQVDGDAVAYMDLADLIHAHRWAGVVNGYWHPLYPALLAVGQAMFRPSRETELGAYYIVNFAIFLAQVAAMWAFTKALDRLRGRAFSDAAAPLLSRDALCLLGVALVVIASQRELSMGKIRPDALLQALMLAAMAALLNALASESLVYPAAMGVCFGLAYLTKSFAFLVALLSIGGLFLLERFVQRRRGWHPGFSGGVALLVFAAIAGPYMSALSQQKGRFDFGDSGALNYAWYSGGVEKMHLQPSMVTSFGHATVALKHPERQLMASPGVYSYRAEPYGTYPDWFDTTFFNERITPHLNFPVLLRRDARNVVLIFRYLLNHPEGWLLLLLLLICGAQLRLVGGKQGQFWFVPLGAGLLMWALYGLVNIEERYVTLAYLLVLLPLFALLRVPPAKSDAAPRGGKRTNVADAGVALLALVALGASLRTALEERRTGLDLPHSWYSPAEFGAARGLAELGVRPGDEVACMGTAACLNQEYWARLAGVRILTEVYNPNAAHLWEQWTGLPNRAEVLDVLQTQGARVLVARFDPGAVQDAGEIDRRTRWVRLGSTDFFALPLGRELPQRLAQVDFNSHEPQAAAPLPWNTQREGGP